MANTRRNERLLSNGRVTIYQRDDAATGKEPSDIWYAKFKIPGKKGRAINRSLKTKNANEAEQEAEDLYFEFKQRNKRNMSLSDKRFELIANAYIQKTRDDTERQAHKPKKDQDHKTERLHAKEYAVDTYLSPYFGAQNIGDISDFEIDQFVSWRKAYWISGPGSKKDKIQYRRKDGKKVAREKSARENQEPSWNTINKELTILRAIFEHARTKRIIEGNQIPTIKNESSNGKPQKKPGLTWNEVRHLLDTISLTMKSQSNPKHKRNHRALISYISFLYTTGVRVTEAGNIKFSDCEEFKLDGKNYTKIYAWGKNQSRYLVALPECVQVIKHLRSIHMDNAKEFGWEFHDDLHLFVDERGNYVKSRRGAINKHLASAGLLYDKDGKKRDVGCFRKAYITTALKSGVIPIQQLAKQVGNSPAIIHQYYDELHVIETPEQFIFDNALSASNTTKPSTKARKSVDRDKFNRGKDIHEKLDTLAEVDNDATGSFYSTLNKQGRNALHYYYENS